MSAILLIFQCISPLVGLPAKNIFFYDQQNITRFRVSNPSKISNEQHVQRSHVVVRLTMTSSNPSLHAARPYGPAAQCDQSALIVEVKFSNNYMARALITKHQ